MDLEEELRGEIEKWSKKLDQSLAETAATSEMGEKFLKNILAYRSDSEHFAGKGDLIKGFECLIWAWAYLEIGRALGHLSQK
ncbi:MAG: DUF357 domain-containing protein [Candidatus Hadarchaeales archaeon]